MEFFIGLMSGTSMDGLDGVLVDLAPENGARFDVRADVHLPMPEDLACELQALNLAGADELHRAALAANALGRLQARAVAELLADARLEAASVRAIGSHGQTVRHRPGEFDGVGYTTQLNAPALLAEACGIAVVADFRSRDLAAGGQGAPLVPAFHAAVFGGAPHSRAILNLGGIANLTLLPVAGIEAGPRGFDCGPGNLLMDGWCRAHLGRPFDEGGRWAAGGRVLPALLARCLADPFFRRPPPKSTGRDWFNARWLAGCLEDVASNEPPAPEDVQATLLELTARAAIDALEAAAPDTGELLVCGGGALNETLMRRLGELVPGMKVAPTSAVGLPAMQVEAMAFAWLARQCLRRQAGNLPGVTGARGPRVLGAIHPA